MTFEVRAFPGVGCWLAWGELFRDGKPLAMGSAFDAPPTRAVARAATEAGAMSEILSMETIVRQQSEHLA